MVPELTLPDTLERMVSAGQVQPPAETGMPDLIPDLAPDVDSLGDLLIADRERERNR
jgi:hypothetical protein